MLFMARAPASMDEDTGSRRHIIRNWLRILPAYVFALSLLAQIINHTAVLLVIVVPQLVPMKYVSTTLGAHKSVSDT